MQSESLTSKIFEAIKLIIDEAKDSLYYIGPGLNAILSRKSLGEALSAMPGYKSSQTNFKKNFYVSVARLKKKGFIKFSDQDHFVITDSGRGVMAKFEIDNIILPDFDPKKWDGVWRVLIFDIPELTRAVRNLFRDKLQELEFYTLQKSVYVTPLVCEKEITGLAKLLNITSGVDIIHASKLGQKEVSARKFFGIER